MGVGLKDKNTSLYDIYKIFDYGNPSPETHKKQ